MENIQEMLSMDLEKEKEYFILIVELGMKAIGKMIKEKEKE